MRQTCEAIIYIISLSVLKIEVVLLSCDGGHCACTRIKAGGVVLGHKTFADCEPELSPNYLDMNIEVLQFQADRCLQDVG